MYNVVDISEVDASDSAQVAQLAWLVPQLSHLAKGQANQLQSSNNSKQKNPEPTTDTDGPLLFSAAPPDDAFLD
jgi:hypothetical protein